MPFNKWWWLLIPLALVLVPAVWLFIQARLSERPVEAGLREGKLRPCPDSPNCVSTEADSEEHKIDPWPYSGTAEEALEGLKRLLESTPRAELVSSEGRYLHAKFRTPLLGFVDDVEFLVDPEASVVRYRSASRVGYSDLGTNRARMESFGERFAAWVAEHAGSHDSGTGAEGEQPAAPAGTQADTRTGEQESNQ